MSEKSSCFYDQHYSRSLFLLQNVKKNKYYPLWRKVVNVISDNLPILELGCGYGALARMLFEEGKNYKKGVDFSKEAISLARKNNPSHKDVFEVKDFADLTEDYFCDYEVFVAIEILEHIENDLGLLKLLPPGCVVVLSVPSFDSAGHVRYFDSLEKAVERYSDILTIVREERAMFYMKKDITCNKWWLLVGEKPAK